MFTFVRHRFKCLSSIKCAILSKNAIFQGDLQVFIHAIVKLMLNSYYEQKPKTYHYNLSEVYLRSCVSNNCFTLRALTRNGKYPLICT